MVRKLGWEKISPKLVACMREGILKNGADGESRTPTGCPIRPSSARVYQFHHIGIYISKSYSLVAGGVCSVVSSVP